MPDKTITVTEEMVTAALNAANEYGRDGGWLTSAGLCRSAITAALAAQEPTDEDARRPLTDTIDFAALWRQERARAEKAERERDEARKSLHEANEVVKSLRAMTARELLDAAREVSHPLPRGGTIPEGAAFWVKGGDGPWEFVSEGPRESFDTSRFPNARYVLLDPPTTKRPEGAEVIARVEAYVREVGDGAVDALDDFLASRGARVVSEDGAR